MLAKRFPTMPRFYNRVASAGEAYCVDCWRGWFSRSIALIH